MSDLTRMARHRVSTTIIASAFALTLSTGGSWSDPAHDRAGLVAATDSYLRHIYAIYLGLRACGELADRTGDKSFRPEVGRTEARAVMHALDEAAGATGVDIRRAWADASPQALASAEALKINPQISLEPCQRMGRIFRSDEANLQNLLRQLGSRTAVVPKDF